MDPDEPQQPLPSILSRSDSQAFGDLTVGPRVAQFAGQDDDETVYIIARRDAVTNLSWISEVALLSLLPILAAIVLNNFGFNINDFVQGRFTLLAIFGYYAFLVTLATIKFNDWFYNVFIVTNRRILDFDFQPLSSFNVAEAELTAIQDVSEAVVGVVPSFFDYGNLLVQTAGERIKFVVNQVPRPTWLRDILVDLAKIAKNPEP